MPNFQNSKIYKIVNDIEELIYIGSTTQKLCLRMGGHRTRAKNNQSNTKLYEHMRNLGIECFKIELIELYPCETVEQLIAREGEYIRNLKPDLNKQIAGRSQKEYYQDKKELIRSYQKGYYDTNKQLILAHKKEKNNCPCGGKYINNRKSLHFRSNIHIKYENEIEQKQSEH